MNVSSFLLVGSRVFFAGQKNDYANKYVYPCNIFVSFQGNDHINIYLLFFLSAILLSNVNLYVFTLNSSYASYPKKSTFYDYSVFYNHHGLLKRENLYGKG